MTTITITLPPLRLVLVPREEIRVEAERPSLIQALLAIKRRLSEVEDPDMRSLALLSLLEEILSDEGSPILTRIEERKEQILELLEDPITHAFLDDPVLVEDSEIVDFPLVANRGTWNLYGIYIGREIRGQDVPLLLSAHAFIQEFFPAWISERRSLPWTLGSLECQRNERLRSAATGIFKKAIQTAVISERGRIERVLKSIQEEVETQIPLRVEFAWQRVYAMGAEILGRIESDGIAFQNEVVALEGRLGSLSLRHAHIEERLQRQRERLGLLRGDVTTLEAGVLEARRNADEAIEAARRQAAEIVRAAMEQDQRRMREWSERKY